MQLALGVSQTVVTDAEESHACARQINTRNQRRLDEVEDMMLRAVKVKGVAEDGLASDQSDAGSFHAAESARWVSYVQAMMMCLSAFSAVGSQEDLQIACERASHCTIGFHCCAQCKTLSPLTGGRSLADHGAMQDGIYHACVTCVSALPLSSYTHMASAWCATARHCCERIHSSTARN